MDPVVYQIIKAIERAKQQFAVGALSNPRADGDHAFDYGIACGRMQGLNEALRLIEDQLKQQEEDHGN